MRENGFDGCASEGFGREGAGGIKPSENHRAGTKETNFGSGPKERDQLQSKLKASEARVVELERLLDEALNRIDWAIDSLQDAAANKN